MLYQGPLGVKGDGDFDWINLDQIYSAFLEKWPSMRHDTVLDGDALCERSDLTGSGLGFASS